MNILDFHYQDTSNVQIWESAFNYDLGYIWNNTPYKNEICQMSFQRFLSCFFRNNQRGVKDRQKLLFWYLAPNFDVSKQESTLVTWLPILPTSNQFFLRTIKNRCVLYNYPPSREFDLSDTEQTTLQSLLEECEFDVIMKRIYQLGKVTNELAVRPQFKNKRLELIFLTPDLYRNQFDEYGNCIEMVIPYETADSDVRSIVNFIRYKDTYDAKGNITESIIEYLDSSFKHKTQEINILGKMPYVFVQLNTNTDNGLEIYGGTEVELAKAQLELNMYDFLSNENIIKNGFSILQIINHEADKLKLGASAVIVKEGIMMGDGMEMPPDISFVSPPQLYADMQDFKATRERAYSRQMGLPNSMTGDTAGLQSGVAMKIDRIELDEARQEDVIKMKFVEKDILSHIIYVLNNDPASQYKGVFSEDLTYSIDYQEQTIYSEPKDEFELLNQMFDKGLLSPLQYVVKLTGNESIKTNDDAINFINENKGFKDAITSGSGESIPTNNQQQGTGATIPNVETNSQSTSNTDTTINPTN